MKKLVKAIKVLESDKEISAFLKDLCTPAEIEAFEERLVIASLLHDRKYSYRDISEKTGASTTTVGRVARFLNQEKNQGYLTVFRRWNDENAK